MKSPVHWFMLNDISLLPAPVVPEELSCRKASGDSVVSNGPPLEILTGANGLDKLPMAQLAVVPLVKSSIWPRKMAFAVKGRATKAHRVSQIMGIFLFIGVR